MSDIHRQPDDASACRAEAQTRVAAHAFVAFLIGLALAGTAHFVQALLAGERLDDPLQARVVAALLSACVFTAIGFVLGLLRVLAGRGRIARTLALVLSVATLTGAVGVHAIGVGTRTFTGTFPSASVFLMVAESPVQFLRVATDSHPKALVTLAAALLLGALASWRGLQRAERLPRGAMARGVVAFVGFCAPAMALTLPLEAGPCFVLSVECRLTPELSWSSDASSRRSAAQDQPLSARQEELLNSGPLLAAGDEWLSAARQPAPPRPNVLLIMLESLPASRLHYAGYPRDVSPHLDALARNSVRFTHAWSTASHSSYAQMAILSSLQPRRSMGLDTYRRLDYPRVLFHDVFHTLGYRTATISSQYEDWQGMRRFQDTGTPTYFRDAKDHSGPFVGPDQKVPDHLTVDHAIRWLSRPSSRRWALYVNLQRTHFDYELPPGAPRPWEPSRPTPGTFDFLDFPREEAPIVHNRYDNALRYVDEQVGRLVAHLRESGELDDTLIVVVSDHGEAFHEHGLVTHSRSLYEPETRTPLLFHWPARLAPEVRDAPVSHVDVLPSLLALVGVPPHPAHQGTSLFPPEPGEGLPARPVHLVTHGYRPIDGIVCWPWKLHLPSDGAPELYDLATDPDEQHDFARAEPRIARQLEMALDDAIAVQLRYHARSDTTRQHRFAPRIARCPPLGPATPQASAR